MSSGLYAALSAANAKMQSLDVTANNLSNANAYGYKRDRFDFEALFRDATQNVAGRGVNFVRVYKNHTDFTQAGFAVTGNPLDLAIDGEGFFKLQGNGRYFYTRLGNFRRDDEGNLANPSGWKVVDEKNRPIAIPDSKTLSIDESGKIFSNGGEAGSIPLFAVNNLADLRKEGRGVFAPEPGLEDRLVEKPRILQKRLEESNVQPLEEMARMIDGLRAFEAYQKVLKTYGNLASRATDLGAVG